MIRRTLMLGALALTLAAGTAVAQDTVKIGLILPMTGPFASTGRQIDGAVKLWLAQNGTTVAGKKIEVILKDDAGTADTTRRLAQELVVNDKVQVLAGFGLTPLALATVPIATQAKIPELVMAAATSSITEQSAYVIRAGFTLPQITVPLADWAAKNGIKKVVTLVTDYGPGIDAETAFKTRFTAAGGEGSGRAARTTAQSRFRAVPAARCRRKAGRGIRVRAVGRRLDLHEAVRRARPRQERRSPDRHRRRHRRRHPERHGRRRARRHHVVPLLGRASVGGEQGLRRRLQEAQRHATQLHVGWAATTACG
jgi:hypothetical protein